MEECDCFDLCGDDPRVEGGLVIPCGKYAKKEKRVEFIKKNSKCPFCGGTPKEAIHTKNFDGSILKTVSCSSCHAGIVGVDNEPWEKWFKRAKTN